MRVRSAGSRMKQTELEPGILDILLPVARASYHGMFIEIKSLKGTVQKNQKEWHILLADQSYKVEVCRRCHQAVSAITEYLHMST